MKGNARNETEFDPICINRQTLEAWNSVKLLGTVCLLRQSGGGGGVHMKIVLPLAPHLLPPAITIFKIGH